MKNKINYDFNNGHKAVAEIQRSKEQEGMAMKEYNVNGTLIIGVDNGYGNTKSAHTVMRTSVETSNSAPTFSKDYLEYKGRYYILSEGHKNFVADKILDDDTYILTLAAIAKELKVRGRHEAKIHLAVGLPLKWVKAQRETFRQYMLRNRYVDYKFREERYLVEIVDCTVMPQCYAAVAENLKDYKGINLLADIGNGTMNLMYLNNGKAAENKSWTEKQGVNQCAIRIKNAIRDETGTELPDDVVENYLQTGQTDAAEPYASIIKQAAEEYVREIFNKLRDYEYNDKLMQLHFMGGGAKIVETVGEYDPERTHFIHDICATAKGYEYYCYMALRNKMKSGKKGDR